MKDEEKISLQKEIEGLKKSHEETNQSLNDSIKELRDQNGSISLQFEESKKANADLVLQLLFFNFLFQLYFKLYLLQQGRIDELLKNCGDSSAQLASFNEKINEKDK